MLNCGFLETNNGKSHHLIIWAGTPCQLSNTFMELSLKITETTESVVKT